MSDVLRDPHDTAGMRLEIARQLQMKVNAFLTKETGGKWKRIELKK